MPFKNDVTFNRPVKAKLYVKLDNGEEWEAKPEDVKQFGYVDRLRAYMAFNKALSGYLHDAGLLGEREDLTDSQLNPIRYLVETAISYPELLPELAERYDGEPSTVDNIVRIEQILKAAATTVVA